MLYKNLIIYFINIFIYLFWPFYAKYEVRKLIFPHFIYSAISKYHLSTARFQSTVDLLLFYPYYMQTWHEIIATTSLLRHIWFIRNTIQQVMLLVAVAPVPPVPLYQSFIFFLEPELFRPIFLWTGQKGTMGQIHSAQFICTKSPASILQF